MTPYTHSSFYDPVGSKPGQPQGYVYANQQSATPNPYPGQPATYPPASYDPNAYGSTYGTQHYDATSQQQRTMAQRSLDSNTTSRSTSGARSVASQNYSHTASDNRLSNATNPYDSSYYARSGLAAMQSRTQANASPLYATASAASTFGRLSLPGQSQASSSTLGNTQSYQHTTPNSSARTYQTAPSNADSSHSQYQSTYSQPQSQQPPPQRYVSPLHAVQAQQQSHSTQASISSNHAPSPQLTTVGHPQQSQQQPSASVEPSFTTVDPSHVYDFRAEQQRKAQAEAEKRRKAEAQGKAEEQALAAEGATRATEEDRKAEAERMEYERREAEERVKMKRAEEEVAARRKASIDRRNEQRRKAREEKRQSKTAATALTQMASASGSDTVLAAIGDTSALPLNDEEAEMRAMFKKMREFNARNPQMLSKLWEEERNAHTAQTSSPTNASAAQPVPAPPSEHSQQKGQQPASSAANQAAPSFKPPPAKAPVLPTASAPQFRVQTPASASPSVAATPPPGSTALWPPDKKGDLAEAAALWLTNHHENRNTGRIVNKEEILGMMETNPSYVQLCKSIEASGIKLDRSGLAKEMLRSVPDGLRGQPPAKPQSKVSAPRRKQTNGVGLPADKPKKKSGRPKKDGPLSYSVPSNNNRNSSTGGVSYRAPAYSNPIPGSGMSAPSPYRPPAPTSVASAIHINTPPVQTPAPGPTVVHNAPMTTVDSRPPPQAPEVTSESRPSEPPRLPANKEEAARKRTFNDLVDLTVGDSDDEAPPMKRTQQFVPSMTGGTNGAMGPPPSLPNNAYRQPMDYDTFMRQIGPSQAVGPSPVPTQPGPVQRGPFQFVNSHANNISSLPSVPSQPAPPSQPKPKGATEEQKQYERMKGKMLVEPIMRDRVARKSKYDSRTIARDVLLATGRHPDMRSLNAHLNSMQKLLGEHGGVVDGTGNKSDLATIKWDIIDPGEPVEEYKPKPSSGGPSAMDAEQTDDADDEDGELRATTTLTARSLVPRAANRKSGLAPLLDWETRVEQLKEVAHNGEERDRLDALEEKTVKQVTARFRKREWIQREAARKHGQDTDNGGSGHVSQDVLNTASGRNAKPRRGRPPLGREAGGASAANDNTNINIDTDTDADDTTTFITGIAPETPAARASPSNAATHMSSGGVGYAAFRQVDEDGNVVKKKGRPVGWRKSIHSREANGLTPAKSASAYAPKSGSRLRLSTGPTGRAEALAKPRYSVYKCAWHDCTAELDNLDHLRKHVVKLHGMPNEEGDLVCSWSNCDSAGQHVDASGKANNVDENIVSFETIEHWLKHVQNKHLAHIAWELGDGPRGGSVSDQHTNTDSYLSDAYGRSVTPVIQPASEQQVDQRPNEDQPQSRSKISNPKQPILISDLPSYQMVADCLTKELKGAREEIRLLEDQKRAEGFVLGREGSTLWNEKRKRGFLDDEDFEDVVEEDD